MNFTSDIDWNFSSVVDNDSTSIPSDDFDYELLLQALREMKVRDLFGEQFHLIFIVTCVVSIIGYITNILNIVVFSRSSLLNSMNVFLMLLAISDILLISTQFAHIVHYIEGFTMYPFYSNYLFSMICTFFESIFVNISNWMVAVVGIWRFVVVTCPQRGPTIFKPNCVKNLIVLIVVFSVVLAIPMFLFLTYTKIHYMSHVFYDQVFTDLAVSDHRLPLKIYWGFLLLRGLVPMIIMIITTIGLVLTLCRQHDQTANKGSSYFVNVRITIMLILLMIFFLLSNLPDSFMFLLAVLYDGDREVQNRYRQATDIIRVFMLANNSLSFFLYYGLGFEFRSTFNKLFCCAKKEKENSVAESATVEIETINHQIGHWRPKMEMLLEKPHSNGF